MRGLSIIRFPSGTYGFAGKVPAGLAFNSSHPGDLATAATCGPGFARRIAEREGRTFETLSWATEAEAAAAAKVAGFECFAGFNEGGV
jgi:hypothetical protein